MANMETTDDTTTEALRLAFLRGAGLGPEAFGALTPDTMETLGKLMAGTLQGMIDLLALRSLVKQEVKADVTAVVLRNNNPLKFFPDSQTVMTQMLRKKMPGFMEPVEAIEDAIDDLRSHQKGVVAGTKASMAKVIHRLRPERVESTLKDSFQYRMISPLRKAALWDLYCQQHNKVMGESQDNFKTLFGPDFLAAYEREVTRRAPEKKA
jgi:type VI secretion system FHA domain protein